MRTKSKNFTYKNHNFKFSFGYDNSTRTYKAVAFYVEEEPGCNPKGVVKVFSLGDNSWRDIRCLPVLPLHCLFYNDNKIYSVHLNGTINWIALRNYINSDVTFDGFVILSLDLSSETYTQLLLPQGFDKDFGDEYEVCKCCSAAREISMRSEEYWCSVLRGKYNGNIGQNGRAASSVGSNLWNALNDIKPMLDRFNYWQVGDGCDINAWCDAWIEEGLCLDQHINIPSQLQGKKVCDLLDEEGRWDWILFDSWMPTSFQQKIAAVLPPHVDNGRDERVGVGGNKKDFSVTSMYNNLCGFNKDDAHYMWGRVWKLKAPERVRTFIWLVMHNKLLTNSLKSVMGLSHAMCSYCRVVEETTLHVLRDCTLAKKIWSHVVPLASRSGLQEWICFNLNNFVMGICEGTWNVFWAMACYLLWNWRNKELHVEGFLRPNRPVQHVRNMAADYIHAMQNSSIMVNRSQVASRIGWVPPRADYIKLNTDGASKKMQLAGCGGVVRGSQGEWIGGYAKCVGMCNAFVAELWGVLEGLRFVRNMGFRKVELCIDSQFVVQVIKNGCVQSSMGVSLLKQIWRLLDLDWNVEVSHTYREANNCADALAMLGCSLGYEITTFEACPSHIRELYDADCMGITTPRLITV
ncbi:hypothetical protein TSUD_259770 [Trifolium subterraneum]|uniref:RNase H type-1 domain-containing protein n=1 Tax=Trifolium subterraneum TaxID=3900 RepID=A0A2Z6M5X2_TRISU|nr:hypothetical protein TSUD_259770 [Trifolium subterraneum]